MRPTIRFGLAASVLAIILAACGTTAGQAPDPTIPPSTPTHAPEPSPTPSPEPTEAPASPSEAPAESPDASPESDGTFTMVDGVAAGGPGGSISEALASGITDPMLVNGVLYKDLDGTIYLASSLTNASAPTFAGPTLQVIGYPESTADWDPAYAEDTGLKEANGVLYFEFAQLFGVVEG